MKLLWVLAGVAILAVAMYPTPATCDADDDTAMNAEDSHSFNAGSATDSNAAAREDKSISIDGMSADEYQKMRSGAEKQGFQAEVSRMMKLIINSLYTNKEVFLRELISNASDALDKIRFLALSDPNQMGTTPDLQIKIHVDRENNVLHITDTGVGMTKAELTKNLGTIAKSGTSEFLASASESPNGDHSNLIGQFGVGFYSAFLVADTVIVTSKHNDDKQYIWESDSHSFSIMEDTREDEQLGRGTRISLYLKEEATDYLEQSNIQGLIKKYSEFINFDIYLYTSKTVEEEEEVEEEAAEEAVEGDAEAKEGDEEEDVNVEEEKEDTPKEKKMVERTVWDWEIINANKPIWNRNTKDVQEEEYKKFYHAFAKDSKDPLAFIHFTAEGEVAFRSILFVPGEAPQGFYNDYGKKKNNLKMYVRRVFITDDFEDMLPKYLSFIQGVVDSDDLPLNVSRESLQQHKLLKVIKKKLIRKALEMLKKMSADDYAKFWTAFGTSIKLGIMEDYANRSRLSKLLRFYSSNGSDLIALDDYVARMKKGQENIFFCAGADRKEAESSPFVERLLKKGYEVLYTIEPIDEYALQNLPEFDGKKFQNVAKEGLDLGESETAKATQEEYVTTYEPLTKWMGENLKDQIDKAVVSTRLADSPCALIAATHGWSGNMERIMKAQAYAKHDDSNNNYYASQKKTLEINPRHPLIKKLLARVEDADADTDSIVESATVMLDAARIRSGYSVGDQVVFAKRIENLLRANLGVEASEEVEAEDIELAQDASEDGDDEEAAEEEEAAVEEEATEEAAHDEF